ncbi:MAG: geranylgeranylglyceryl/heptaprenylglyceryl phosphate synthase [Bacteroidota bacterium]|nr:geranylgeranylglyceryl/heptaprenylglyceryl phosphate synthase [Bacteroidota bacterium]
MLNFLRNMTLLNKIQNTTHKLLAVLIDPEKESIAQIKIRAKQIQEAGADFIFIGGSLTSDDTDQKAAAIKEVSSLPLISFPGNILQITDHADALLLLSLISGRNPELLIGQHVTAAPLLKRKHFEIISVGYMLIDGGQSSSVQYISNTNPIPADKPDIAAATAYAGEMLGLKLIYLEAGSGAKQTVSSEVISAVKKNIRIPLITGGGIKTKETLKSVCSAGADVVVVGNLFETKPLLMKEFSQIVHSYTLNGLII